MRSQLLPDQVTRVVERAVLAPSIHNSQPWRFHYDGDAIEVWADRSRRLAGVDPTGRQLAISVGGAAEYAALALRAEGYDVHCEVLPDPERPDLLAQLTPLRPHTVDAVTRALVHCMTRRTTYRAAFDPRPIPEHTVEKLRDAVHSAGCGTMIVSGEQRPGLVVLLERAEASERSDPRYREELNRWRSNAAHATEGIPDSALVSNASRVSRVPLRNFTTGDVAVVDTPAVDEPVLLLISTTADELGDWVAAGRAMARLLLHATAAGLQASPVTQSLDQDTDRARTGHELGVVGHPQLLLRLGYGTAVTPSTPRRPLRETLTFPATN
ncbi:MAG: hypothetical protein QOE64_2197 [Frankiales bacterium]|nr:hypothetical protein [Frankiales bacterium]